MRTCVEKYVNFLTSLWTLAKINLQTAAEVQTFAEKYVNFDTGFWTSLWFSAILLNWVFVLDVFYHVLRNAPHPADTQTDAQTDNERLPGSASWQASSYENVFYRLKSKQIVDEAKFCSFRGDPPFQLVLNSFRTSFATLLEHTFGHDTNWEVYVTSKEFLNGSPKVVLFLILEPLFGAWYPPWRLLFAIVSCNLQAAYIYILYTICQHIFRILDLLGPLQQTFRNFGHTRTLATKCSECWPWDLFAAKFSGFGPYLNRYLYRKDVGQDALKNCWGAAPYPDMGREFTRRSLSFMSQGTQGTARPEDYGLFSCNMWEISTEADTARRPRLLVSRPSLASIKNETAISGVRRIKLWKTKLYIYIYIYMTFFYILLLF